MDVTAGIITIVTSACTLASRLRQLVRSIRERDENARNLEDKVETLAIALGQIRDAYGSETGLVSSSGEMLIRQNVANVIRRCINDLEIFNHELTRFSRAKNWVQVAWRQQVVAPSITRIEESIAGHLQILHILFSLIQGRQLNQIRDFLARNPSTTIFPSPGPGDQVTESDSIFSEVTTLLEVKEPEHNKDNESVIKGMQLLQAIKNGDVYTFESLLFQSDTGLKEQDLKGRTPLLLAASLGRGDMVKKLLAEYADAMSSERETDDHRMIDLNAADKLGRTALHYIAEFEMYNEAEILLGHDVNVNARDNGGSPPVYYAIKNRKYYATKLLLARTTGFQLPPTPISSEIKKLLKESSSNRRLKSMFNPGAPRHNSICALPRDNDLSLPLPPRRNSQ
ncbi:MAG: hypothetical protein Q9167_003174 [Letrouitia subvulpina]